MTSFVPLRPLPKRLEKCKILNAQSILHFNCNLFSRTLIPLTFQLLLRFFLTCLLLVSFCPSVWREWFSTLSCFRSPEKRTSWLQLFMNNAGFTWQKICPKMSLLLQNALHFLELLIFETWSWKICTNVNPSFVDSIKDSKYATTFLLQSKRKQLNDRC